MACVASSISGIKRSRRRSQTIHEVGQVDEEAALLSVVVRQCAIVDEVPAKSIRNHDDDALGSDTFSWSGDVGLQTMKGLDFATRDAFVNITAEALGTGHVVRFCKRSR